MGAGWRLVIDARALLLPDEPPNSLGLRKIAIAPTETYPETLVERDGLMASWFDRHDCVAAIVRPDHYVFGTARTAAELALLIAELEARLR